MFIIFMHFIILSTVFDIEKKKIARTDVFILNDIKF